MSHRKIITYVKDVVSFFNKKSLGYLTEKTGFIVAQLEVRGLDIMDYLLLKEHEDGFNYTDKLQDLMNLLQAVLDKNKIGNHLRITFQKSF